MNVMGAGMWRCAKWAVVAVGVAVFAGGIPSARAIETKAQYAFLVDATTGAVMLDKGADTRMAPSSMSKLMTTYMLFTRLKVGAAKLDDTFLVSEKAWRMQGSKTFIHVGDAIKVEDLIRGIIIQSGNDACIAVAEGIGGTEEAFAVQMNETAKKIGLENSNFMNATGWPDDNHYVTPRDLATLAKRIIEDFPEYYSYYAEPQFTFNNITQHNRNLLLSRGIGVDGLKTGHTEAAGYGITISAKQGERRIILVVNGLTSEAERAEEAEQLVRYAFREFENKTIFAAGAEVATANVWQGQSTTVPLVAERDVVVTLPRSQRDKFKVKAVYDAPLRAPIAKGSKLGELRVTMPGGEEQAYPLVAAADVERQGFLERILTNLRYRLTGTIATAAGG